MSLSILYRYILFYAVALLQQQDLTFGTDISASGYDFIVVGAGSAGSAVAGRLTEDPNVSVLLIEAGGPPPLDSEVPAKSVLGTEYDWMFKIKRQANACKGSPNNQCIYHRGRVLGGCSTVNAMMYVRGNHKDYDRWAALGNIGWGWKDVLPYFLKSEGNTIPWLVNDTVYHNSNGPMTISDPPYPVTQTAKLFIQGAVELGYRITDFNGASQIGFHQTPFTMRDGSRCSTYKAYLIPALLRPNIKILTNSRVLKVLFDSNKRAIGVTFSTNGTVRNATAKKEVIISAGAIQSPQILMLSGVGPADHLNKFNIPVVANLPGVGSNLIDHVINLAVALKTTTLETITLDSLMSQESLNEWLYQRQGPLTVSLGLEANGFMSFSNGVDKDVPDVQLAITTNGNPFLAGSKASFALYTVLLHPKCRGTVTLESADPLADPIVDPQYLCHEDDVKTLLKGTKNALKLINSTAFKNQDIKFDTDMLDECKNFTFLSDDYLICGFEHLMLPGLHAVGTCKMGIATDSMAVVDPVGLRVYNVQGLRVADTSVMPEITSGNTHAPAVMIGEKAADAVKGHYRLA